MFGKHNKELEAKSNQRKEWLDTAGGRLDEELNEEGWKQGGPESRDLWRPEKILPDGEVSR
jgi:hypothetical protein